MQFCSMLPSTRSRPQHRQPGGPDALAAGGSLYEALCYYRKSQGTCYANSPALVQLVRADARRRGSGSLLPDAQTVSCCKSFVLMISPGVPDSTMAYPGTIRLFRTARRRASVCWESVGAGGHAGSSTSWLDNIATTGRPTMSRPACPGASCVTGTQAVTSTRDSMAARQGQHCWLLRRSTGIHRRNGNQFRTLARTLAPFRWFQPGIRTSRAASNGIWTETYPDTYFDASQSGDLQTRSTRPSPIS